MATFSPAAHPVLSTKVVLEQQLPPTFSWFVWGCVEPSKPDENPGSVGLAQTAQAVVLAFLPYDRQKSMPMYMPVM